MPGHPLTDMQIEPKGEGVEGTIIIPTDHPDFGFLITAIGSQAVVEDLANTGAVLYSNVKYAPEWSLAIPNQLSRIKLPPQPLRQSLYSDMNPSVIVGTPHLYKNQIFTEPLSLLASSVAIEMAMERNLDVTDRDHYIQQALERLRIIELELIRWKPSEQDESSATYVFEFSIDPIVGDLAPSTKDVYIVIDSLTTINAEMRAGVPGALKQKSHPDNGLLQYHVWETSGNPATYEITGNVSINERNIREFR